MILDALKKRLYEKDQKHLGKWLKELSAVVWVLRTHPSYNTGVSLYFLVLGSEAVLPADVAFRAPRIENYDEDKNDQAWQDNVDYLEKVRLVTCVWMAKYLDGLHKYYNRNIQERSFAVDDLILHKNQKTDRIHKLSSPWEGPYIIKAVTRPGSYRLYDQDGVDIPNSWHIDPLRHFYP
jgi:hypothetical protein